MYLAHKGPGETFELGTTTSTERSVLDSIGARSRHSFVFLDCTWHLRLAIHGMLHVDSTTTVHVDEFSMIPTSALQHEGSDGTDAHKHAQGHPLSLPLA